jgi:hypothetical protein
LVLSNVSCNGTENFNQYNISNNRMTQQYPIIVQGQWSNAYTGKGRGLVEKINEEFSLQMGRLLKIFADTEFSRAVKNISYGTYSMSLT